MKREIKRQRATTGSGSRTSELISNFKSLTIPTGYSFNCIKMSCQKAAILTGDDELCWSVRRQTGENPDFLPWYST